MTASLFDAPVDEKEKVGESEPVVGRADVAADIASFMAGVVGEDVHAELAQAGESAARADAGAPPGEDDDAASRGGYAMKLGARRRRRAHAIPVATREQRLEAVAARESRKRMGRMAAWLAIPLVIAACAIALLGGTGAPAGLPREFAPADFATMLALEETSRVGTMFHAKLKEAPPPGDDHDFRGRVSGIGVTLRSAGYETLLIQAPDGTTLAWGDVADPTFAPPGTRGT